jgi:cysteine desulfurase/selenocysteine lyase
MMPPVTSDVLDVARIRQQFPALHQQVNGKPLVYLDNAATSQKPGRVINALTHYYEGFNANIHRGIHALAEQATQAFEATREAVRHFIGAAHTEEIIFTRGVTESINLVANAFGKAFIKPGDEVIVSGLEHHSNIVPWQLACEERGAMLRVIPVLDSGELDLAAYQQLLSPKTRIVAVNHASNSLGTINPVAQIISLAHSAGACVLLDGAQAAPHLDIDVQALNCDFYCLSSHKMYGPTGVGVLYGKKHLLEQMPPYMGGGEMIKDVTFAKTTYNDLPYKFEAGTPNIADVVAFKEAIGFLHETGTEAIRRHEDSLLAYTQQRLRALPGVRLIGVAKEKVSVQSFVVEGLHPFDVGQLLDARGIAVRTGHHCTQPLMDRFGIEGTVRASYAVYNTMAEVDSLAEGLERIIKTRAGGN